MSKRESRYSGRSSFGRGWSEPRPGRPGGANGRRAKGGSWLPPFSIAELLARVHAVLRRSPLNFPGRELCRIGDLDVNFAVHHASRGGQRVDFTAREFALLK